MMKACSRNPYLFIYALMYPDDPHAFPFILLGNKIDLDGGGNSRMA
jgi:hypothetical protein